LAPVRTYDCPERPADPETRRNSEGKEVVAVKDYVSGRTLKWLKVKQREYRVEERGWETKP
jgi:hypothetical protein